MKKYILFSLFFLVSCARPLTCPLIWPFGCLPGDNPFRWFLLIVLAVVVIYLIVRSDKKKKDEAPLEILKKRYAKGEITREEYKKMKK
jgi:putative membrane protein